MSWDFTPIPDTGFDLEGWFAEGWLGPTAVSLAGEDVFSGMDWWISTWDNSVSYCLSFYPNSISSYDGEVVLECFYAGDSAVKAQWQGWWRIETGMEQPSRLYLDLMLLNGEDMDADENGSILPIFPEYAQAIELTLGYG